MTTFAAMRRYLAPVMIILASVIVNGDNLDSIAAGLLIYFAVIFVKWSPNP